MTDQPKKRGGLRTPAGGRPRKDNVILHCHVPKARLEAIDEHRGTLSRGDYIATLVPPAPRE
jgi:hypothetical protein